MNGTSPIIDTARIVRRVYVPVLCPSVCLSVPSFGRCMPLGGFAAVGSGAGDIDRLLYDSTQLKQLRAVSRSRLT